VDPLCKYLTQTLADW